MSAVLDIVATRVESLINRFSELMIMISMIGWGVSSRFRLLSEHAGNVAFMSLIALVMLGYALCFRRRALRLEVGNQRSADNMMACMSVGVAIAMPLAAWFT